MIKAYIVDKRQFVIEGEGKPESLVAKYVVDMHLKTIGLSEKEMEYSFGKHGKPYFKNKPDLFFSISHSSNLVLVVFSDKEIGCDIQVVKKVDSKIYDKVLTENEKLVLEGIKDEVSRNKQFFIYWAIKEALVKKTGEGLSADLRKVSGPNVYIEERELKDTNEKYIIAITNGIQEKIEFGK